MYDLALLFLGVLFRGLIRPQAGDVVKMPFSLHDALEWIAAMAACAELGRQGNPRTSTRRTDGEVLWGILKLRTGQAP